MRAMAAGTHLDGRSRTASGRGRTPATRARELAARARGLPGWVGDGALALLVLAIDVWFNGSVWSSLDPAWPPWLRWAALALGTLPLAVRRRAPLSVFAVLAATAVASTAIGLGDSELGLCIAVFTIAVHCPRSHSLPALGVLVVAKVVVGLAHERMLPWLPILVFSYLVAWTLGDQRRTQRALTRQLRRHAEHLEREREHRIRLAAADERARIARDLHDVVAHSVSVMVLHTAAARRTLSRDPARAEQSFAQVERTGRQSLAELRQLLGVLRDDGHTAQLTPQPRLIYLAELVDGFREAGLPVRVEVVGDTRELPTVLDMCAYRIVQEALTNALKHAGARAVDVHIRYLARTLRIEVVDDGQGCPGGHPHGAGGHGLVGMRERAALVNGTLHAGHRDSGGFEVVAVLPVEV